jgi:DeoR/GlpR family transcriptional regulator of sugar metabolism
MSKPLDNLTADERRQTVVDLVMTAGSVEVDELAQRFDVSRMTVHRDLDLLEGQGVLRKVRNGATALPASNFESDVRYRLNLHNAAKERLAEAALEYLNGVQSVCLDDATTLLPLARLLAKRHGITIASNFLPIIKDLTERDGVRLIALGGEYHSRFDTFTGMICEQNIGSLYMDAFVTSTTAVSDGVAYHPDPGIVKVKRAMMAAATKRLLLVDDSKFEKTALYRVAPLRDFDAVVVSASLDRELVAALSAMEVNVLVARKA